MCAQGLVSNDRSLLVDRQIQRLISVRSQKEDSVLYKYLMTRFYVMFLLYEFLNAHANKV